MLTVFAWLTEGWRPSVPALCRAFGWFRGCYSVALAADALTDRNYAYLRDRPVFAGWPDRAYFAGGGARDPGGVLDQVCRHCFDRRPHRDVGPVRGHRARLVR